MQYLGIILFSGGLLFLSGILSLKAEDEKIILPEEHCVAYTTPEKILFFSDYQVVGKSCKVSSWTEHDGNQLRFVINIPLNSFDSGINARDKDVMKILDADNFPYVRFETDWFSKTKITKILLDGKSQISGFLFVSGRKYLISLDMVFSNRGTNYSFRGILETNYNFFNLSPPRLGVFATVTNFIRIIINLQSEKIVGFEKLIKPKS